MPRKYDIEIKSEAVQMAAEPRVTNRDVEKRLGIGQEVLSRWKRQLRSDSAQAFEQQTFRWQYPYRELLWIT